ncbi:MAG: ferritin-like domain-containing protein [Ruminococcaceae bacterium]|nr:ferritin-like domain-containing protein [Oscillospiraceae bacterium]
MEQTTKTTEGYDYRQYDRIWQRVAPALEPYPAGRSGVGLSAQTGMELSPAQLRQESQLPGAEVDPCCMGSAAMDMLEVLTGFAEEELMECRFGRALSRQAPVWARQRLQEMAARQGESARRLMAVYYLVTGECYRPTVGCDRVCVGRWCPALRERYHARACSGLNYARAAEGTTDPCLRKLLNELSETAYCQAETLLRLLERSLDR